MTLILKATLVPMAAWMATWLLRKSSASVREAVWSAALISLILLPAAAWIAPEWTPAAMADPIRIDASMPVAMASGFAFRLWHVWLAGALLVMARLSAGIFRLEKMRRNAQAIDEPLAPRGVRVLISSEAVTPMAWFSSILLPAAALEWTPELRRSVVTHELAHVFGRDAAMQVLIECVCAVYWFHPLVWFAARMRRHERELACDDRVLRLGVNPADYAGHLLSVAKEIKARWTLAPSMASESGLETRIGAVLNPARNRRGLGHVGLVATLAAMFALTIPLASFAFQDGKIYKVGNGVTAPKLISRVEPKYTEAAKDAKIEGAVVLTTIISTDGWAESVVVKRGLDSGLDQNAMDAVKQWRFSPGSKDGKPVRVSATIEVNFKLK